MAHRHLSEAAGRELTKAAIDDIITRGNIGTWRKLVQGMNDDETGRIARRVNDLALTLGCFDLPQLNTGRLVGAACRLRGPAFNIPISTGKKWRCAKRPLSLWDDRRACHSDGRPPP
jgi:hypothetical protein